MHQVDDRGKHIGGQLLLHDSDAVLGEECRKVDRLLELLNCDIAAEEEHFSLLQREVPRYRKQAKANQLAGLRLVHLLPKIIGEPLIVSPGRYRLPSFCT